MADKAFSRAVFQKKPHGQHTFVLARSRGLDGDFDYIWQEIHTLTDVLDFQNVAGLKVGTCLPSELECVRFQ